MVDENNGYLNCKPKLQRPWLFHVVINTTIISFYMRIIIYLHNLFMLLPEDWAITTTGLQVTLSIGCMTLQWTDTAHP